MQLLTSQCNHRKLGPEKEKNIRSHIWVLNSVMHDVMSSVKKKPVDLQVLDFKQCFDALWLEECLNDLFEGGVDDNMLPLLYESGRNVNIAVKTSSSLSNRKTIDNIVDLQKSPSLSQTHHVHAAHPDCLDHPGVWSQGLSRPLPSHHPPQL